MAVKIYDVAKKAGVSVGTVSRVFNDYADVSDKTKAKILQVAKELGYSPNIAAKTLSSKSLKTIALILNDLIASKVNGISMQILYGVYKYTESHNMQFVLYPTTTELQHEKTFEQFCLERNITGAVVQGMHTDDPYVNQIIHSSIPVVMVDLKLVGKNTATISIDNVKAEKEATELILAHGKRKLVLINGNKNAQITFQREAGFREAMSSHGIAIDEYQVQYADFDGDIAARLTAQVLDEHPDVEGFVCASDGMALSVMNEVKKRNYLIPRDIEIIGFDNIIVTEYTQPPLSTVEQNMDKIGENAAALVTRLINGDKTVLQENSYSPYEIISRESTQMAKPEE